MLYLQNALKESEKKVVDKPTKKSKNGIYIICLFLNQF